MTKLIGITGIKGSGKSTLSSMLAELIPNAEIVAFADALRYEVVDMVNCIVDNLCPEEAWHGTVTRAWLEERKATIFGPLLQGFGEFRRQWDGTDYWVGQLEKQALRYGDHPVIIPDVRYPNEADFIHSKGGLLVAINGPSRWEGDTRSSEHPSETNVQVCKDMADFFVDNRSDLKALRQWAHIISSEVLANVGKGAPA